MVDVSISLAVSHISTVLAVFGLFIVGFGLLSYFLKERLYISDTLLCLAVGIAVGPIALNWVDPSEWHDTIPKNGEKDELTFQLSRIVVGIQVLFTGISLPKAYLKKTWRSLTILLLPVMTLAWLVVAAIIILLIPGLTYLEALVISACVTPTDPVLANSIVKGRFAEKHLTTAVRNLILAESGANDGLGYPFIFFALLLMKHQKSDGTHSLGSSIADWILSTWIYQIVLSILLGTIVGFVGRITLKAAEKRKLIDQESFLAYGIGLAFLTMGAIGTLGSDDLLACFVAGNVFTWDDWFRVKTEDDSFQAVIDSLINVGIFLYVGAAMPWSEFGNTAINLSPPKLVGISLLLLLWRRPPFVALFARTIKELSSVKETAFLGWFGPIGVSAMYYVEVALEVLPEDRHLLRSTIRPIVWFIILTSVIAHGITVPIAHFGPNLYRTLSISKTTSTLVGSRIGIFTPKRKVTLTGNFEASLGPSTQKGKDNDKGKSTEDEEIKKMEEGEGEVEVTGKPSMLITQKQ